MVGGIVGKAAGAMVGEGAAQATLPGIVSATEVSVTEVTGTIGGAVGAGATGLALDGKSGDGTPLMARAQSAVTPAHVSWSDVRNWNGTIRQGVGDALPKPVNEALEGALNYGEQKVGKAIGTPSPRRDAGEPASQARQADGKDAEDATKGNASPRGSR